MTLFCLFTRSFLTHFCLGTRSLLTLFCLYTRSLLTMFCTVTVSHSITRTLILESGSCRRSSKVLSYCIFFFGNREFFFFITHFTLRMDHVIHSQQYSKVIFHSKLTRALTVFSFFLSSAGQCLFFSAAFCPFLYWSAWGERSMQGLNFSKVVPIVALYSKYTRALPYENFLQDLAMLRKLYKKK